MMDLEIPLVMENDGNVEKAEAYTKDLDDVSKLGFIYQILSDSYRLHTIVAHQTMNLTLSNLYVTLKL